MLSIEKKRDRDKEGMAMENNQEGKGVKKVEKKRNKQIEKRISRKVGSERVQSTGGMMKKNEKDGDEG